MSAGPTPRVPDRAKEREPHAYIASGAQTWAEAAQEYWLFPLIMMSMMMDNASPLLSLLVLMAALPNYSFSAKCANPSPAPVAL